MYKKINDCRVCGNKNLQLVVDLGTQYLTGVFPKTKDEEITKGPLLLLKCYGDDTCGLLQLGHSYDSSEMYGDNYGYRSGLNQSMVDHLEQKVKKILQMVSICKGDIVIDIGSNDSTTLKFYPENGPFLVGVDPTGENFLSYYPEHISLIPDFFSSALVKENFGDRKAKVITSFSMFYDLEDPVSFMREVHEVLDEDGIWVFEQSYMPTMLERNSYDTICHEHLEYYSLKQIKWMADLVGFVIRDVEFNDINGGSFSVVAEKADGRNKHSKIVDVIINSEKIANLDKLQPYKEFDQRIRSTRESLTDFISDKISQGKSICALGASTKGNVILQYCGLTEKDIHKIGEVNEDKYGSFTPGSVIPIISENQLLDDKPDYLIVLPWHFKDFFLSLDKLSGLTLVFPLPKLEIIKL